MAVRFTLDNGLTVVFDALHAARVAAFQVWVKVGSADERLDQAGLAHLHEHMLFKGTQSRGPGEIARTIEAHGGEINAWTSFDETVYHVVIASPFARTGLEVLGDAVRRSAFDPEELAREIEVVCEEIKRGDDVPARRAQRDLFSTAYKVHPYQRPVIGWEETVRSFDRAKVVEFYRRHYAPSNLVLAVAGDLEEAELRRWVEEIFGGPWDRQPAPRPARAEEPPLAERRGLLRTDDVKEVLLHLAFPVPAEGHPDAPALDMLAMIAGQGDASRLALEVKRKRGLVRGIRSGAQLMRDSGLWTTSLTVADATLGPALEETVRVLTQLRRERVGDEELNTLKSLVEADAIYARETVQGLARKLGFYESMMGGIEAEARYYEAIAKLTPESLQETAERYFRFDRALLTGLLPPGVAFTEAEAFERLDRVSAETTFPPHERKVKTVPAAPMRVMGSARAARPEVVVERLPSGARVVIREETSVPLFAIRAAFPGGTRYESETDNGLSNLVARVLTRGTPSHDAEELSHAIEGLAGALHAMGGRNSVNLRGEFLSKHFHRGFELFTEVLTEPTFAEAELERERQLVLQQLHTRDDRPANLAFELFSKALFQSHPYRLPTQGEIASVERITRQALRDYHARHMDPSQLTLCVVGDVRVDEVLARAHAAFGKPRGAAVPPPVVAPEPGRTQPVTAQKKLPRNQSHLVIGFEGLRVTDPDRRALEVLSTLLSGQGGRLFQELREKRSMAYSVTTYDVQGIDPGSFAVYMGTSPEKVDAALAGIRAELQRVRDEPVPAAELERAKQNLIGTHEIGLQKNSARATLLGLDFCFGVDLDNFAHYPERIAQVSSADVQQVARRLIDFDRSALAIVGP